MDRANNALIFLYQFYDIDDVEECKWILDQLVKILTGSELIKIPREDDCIEFNVGEPTEFYKEWVDLYQYGPDDNNTEKLCTWETGKEVE